jgi:hypothetical protein
VSDQLTSDDHIGAGPFDFATWLSRYDAGSLAIRSFRATHPDGRWGGLEAPWGWTEARREYDDWLARTYPKSAVARAETARLHAAVEASVAQRRQAPPPPEGEDASLVALLSAALAVIAEILEDLASLRAPELQHRPRRILLRLGERIQRLRGSMHAE